MKTTTWRWIIVSVITLAVALVAHIQYPGKTAIHPVTYEEETAAAEALLAEKLSGPRYFSPQVVVALEDRGRWIEVDDALAQVPRIVAERGLGPVAEHAIGQLIVKLAEPHPYRVVGGRRIQLLRLNLSLDAIK
jgi:K+-transporting ATPase c subunit